MLLEAGILGILAAPWLPTSGGMGNKPRDLTTMWMVKWLLFRLMFASGVVKLQSGCPTWWGLTGKTTDNHKILSMYDVLIIHTYFS